MSGSRGPADSRLSRSPSSQTQYAPPELAYPTVEYAQGGQPPLTNYPPSGTVLPAGPQYFDQRFLPPGADTNYLQAAYPSRLRSSSTSGVPEPALPPPSHPIRRSSSFREDEPLPGAGMMSGTQAGYYSMPAPMPAYSAGPSYPSNLSALPPQNYYPPYINSSGLSRPAMIPSVTPWAAPDVARQRERHSQQSRRQLKLETRARREQLPGNAAQGSGVAQRSDFPVDFSVTAPPATSPYVQQSRVPPPRLPTNSDYNRYMNTATGSPSYTENTYSPSAYPLNTVAPPMLQPQAYPSPAVRRPSPQQSPAGPVQVVDRGKKPQCWEHGCNGREFSTFSNLLRHQREKSGSAAKSYCPNCGAEFTRTTARNGHMEHGKCKSRRPSDTPR